MFCRGMLGMSVARCCICLVTKFLLQPRLGRHVASLVERVLSVSSVEQIRRRRRARLKRIDLRKEDGRMNKTNVTQKTEAIMVFVILFSSDLSHVFHIRTIYRYRYVRYILIGTKLVLSVRNVTVLSKTKLQIISVCFRLLRDK